MKQSIYVELDALLDTRLGTLHRMDPALVEQALDAGYKDRTSDRWVDLGLNVDQARYDDLYRRRDVTTLKQSRPTDLAPIITEMTSALGKASIEDPRIEEITLDVNVWPYRLNAEVKDAIADAVREWVSIDCKVAVVDYDHGSLTPTFIDRRYVALILYDFDGWFQAQHDALLEKRLPTVSVIAPALYANGKPDEEVVINGSPVDPFSATELALVEYLSLVLKDAKYYSLIGV